MSENKKHGNGVMTYSHRFGEEVVDGDPPRGGKYTLSQTLQAGRGWGGRKVSVSASTRCEHVLLARVFMSKERKTTL